MGYADALGQLDELFRTPEVYYYAHYYLNLMSPAGVVPDFGDAAWTQNWQHFFVFFEAAAAQLNDPDDGVGRPADCRRGSSTSRRRTTWGWRASCWTRPAGAAPASTPAAPTHLSGEVMEDVQGKKVVFRNGWKPESTYLLLNYRDEGDGGMNFRDYLRDSIPVEEEKMTHGHADENSIPLLMSGGSRAAARRRVPRLHAERPVRRLPAGLLPQPPRHPAREDLHGPDAGRPAVQHERRRARAARARVPPQRRLLPADPDAQGRLPVAARVRLQPHAA